MGLFDIVTLLAILASSSVALTSDYPVPFRGYTPYAYSNIAMPRNLPFRPLFNYAYQAEAPWTSIITSPYVPATAFSRVIYNSPNSGLSQQNNLYRGFSYQTQYTAGGHSQVIFVTGSDSKKLMEQNMEYFNSLVHPQNNKGNATNSSGFTAPLNARTQSSLNESLNNHGNPLNAPFPNFQQSSIHRSQLFPSHTFPLLGNPMLFHSMINSFSQTFGHIPQTSQENSHQNYNGYNPEAQESMISEIRRVLAPGMPESELNTVDQELDALSRNKISNAAIIVTSSSAPDTTQNSSESTLSSTEQITTHNSIQNISEIASTDSQETLSTEQTTSTMEDNVTTATVTSTEVQTVTTVPLSNETTGTSENKSEETTQSEILSESVSDK